MIDTHSDYLIFGVCWCCSLYCWSLWGKQITCYSRQLTAIQANSHICHLYSNDVTLSLKLQYFFRKKIGTIKMCVFSEWTWALLKDLLETPSARQLQNVDDLSLQQPSIGLAISWLNLVSLAFNHFPFHIVLCDPSLFG